MNRPATTQPPRPLVDRVLATFAISASREEQGRALGRSAGSAGSSTRRFRAATALAVAAVVLLTMTGTQFVGAGAAAARPVQETGFSQPFSGPQRFEYLAPTQATNPQQINLAIGQKRADRIARKLGLKKKHTLTERQYRWFITGRGLHGSGDPEAAKLADASVRIFTNTNGRPLSYDTVLASYGLFVKENGWLMSLANEDAPTRIANVLLAPGGYVNTWFLANHAKRSLIQLYRSAYKVEAYYGNQAQQQSGKPQLVTNVKPDATTHVGMSMAPALWLTNFALLYTLNPEIAAYMPAYWAPIPATVADAILASPTGQVPYLQYASYFPPRSR